MHHLAAFNTNVAAAAVDSQLNGIADQVLTRSSGNEYQAFQDLDVMALYCSGVSISRAQLVTPRLRYQGNHQIEPMNVALLPATNPNLQDLRDSPVRINAGETFVVQATNSLGMGNEQEYAIAALATPGEALEVPTGEVSVLRFTGTITTVAQSWSGPGTITPAVNLPAGDYDVFGLTVQGANLIAARIVFPNQLFRPGSLCKTNLGDRSRDEVFGRMGLWGTFNNLSLVQLDLLSNAAAATAIEGRLWIRPHLNYRR